MQYIKRTIEKTLRYHLGRKKSILLLGPRQTGKTTLLKTLQCDLFISLINPNERQTYEKNPQRLQNEIEAYRASHPKRKLPLVLLDEVQKVPGILDSVQELIDERRAQFILTGSSARKLRKGGVNLLPGRVISLRLDPFSMVEFHHDSLEDLLLYGSLPGINSISNSRDKEIELESYAETYLEQEVRAEAIVRNVGMFHRFLELAAIESGKIVSFRNIGREIGVSHTTITGYYEILHDCLIAERIDPIIKSRTRKKLTRSSRYIFFDLGVRRICAREGTKLPPSILGDYFEQLIGLELLRQTRYSKKRFRVLFWRDPEGPEVDWVLEIDNEYIPIEVKWSQNPEPRDAKHIQIFLKEYQNTRKGFIVCRCTRPFQISPEVTAIPWQNLNDLIFKLL